MRRSWRQSQIRWTVLGILVVSCKSATVLPIRKCAERGDKAKYHKDRYLVFSRKLATVLPIRKCAERGDKAKYQVLNRGGEPGLRGEPAASGAEKSRKEKRPLAVRSVATEKTKACLRKPS